MMTTPDIRTLALRPQLLSILFFKSPAVRRKTVRSDSPAELILMLDGIYTARADEVVRAEAGDAVFWPAGALRIEENDPAKPFQCYSIYLRWRGAPPHLPRGVRDSDGIMRFLAMQILAMNESRTVLPAAVPNAFLAAILAEYVRRAATPSDPLEAKVLVFLSAHRAAPFSLRELARHIGLERHHFGRVFKSRTGFSPMDYVRRKRMEWACSLMGMVPPLSMAAIAERVGIRDDAELRRQLRRHTGMGARALRKTLRAKAPLPTVVRGA